MLEKILFVDDEPGMLSSYKRQFWNLYSVELCDCAEQALQLLNTPSYNNDFAVIISDYLMPNMDGIEFLKEVQMVSPLSSRIIVTGATDLNIAVRAVNEGNVFRFLTKPITKAQFLPIIKEGINQYALNKQIIEKFSAEESNSNILTTCSECRKIHFNSKSASDMKNWQPMEIYFKEKFGVNFSHGLCPECVQKILKELK